MTARNKTARRVLPGLGFVLSLGLAPCLLAGLAQPVTAAETTARQVNIAPGVQLDSERGVLIAAGSCAADLYAVSAEVARYKAERLARVRAEARLRRALSQLQREPRLRGKLAPELLAQLDPAQAKVATIEYAATGSVSLRLELSVRDKPRPPDDSNTGAALPSDGGASEGDKGP